MMLPALLRLAWLRLTERVRQRNGTERERDLAASSDRFEVERRERAWNRGENRDGSLLGG